MHIDLLVAKGKGLEGVMEKSPDYFNPFLDILEGR